VSEVESELRAGYWLYKTFKWLRQIPVP